jgi:hypothetical protein
MKHCIINQKEEVTMNKELQFLIYNTPQENIKIDAVVKDETIWLTQKAMAALFGVQIPAIISAGYRINSVKATAFRQWATKTLKEFITKGFVLDDERIKQGKTAFLTRHCGFNPQSPIIL